MRRTGRLALGCLVLCAGAVSAEAEVSALEIHGKSYDPATRELAFELRNTSQKVITAWRLSLARADSEGHAQRSTLDQDFWMNPVPACGVSSSDSGGERRQGPLFPGQSLSVSRRVDFGDEESGFSALSLEVVAVVFDDASHEGAREAAETILAARAAGLEEAGRLLVELEADRRREKPRQAWVAALGQKAQRLRRRGAETDASLRPEVASRISAIRVALAEWLEATADEVALAVDPLDSLDRLTSDLESRYRAGRSMLDPAGERANAGVQDGGER